MQLSGNLVIVESKQTSLDNKIFSGIARYKVTMTYVSVLKKKKVDTYFFLEILPLRVLCV